VNSTLRYRADFASTGLESLVNFNDLCTMKEKDAIKALSALAQPTRLGVFRLLVTAGPDGLSVGVIQEELELASATLSFHLKELTHAGLVTSRQDGRFVYYAPAIEHMNDLVGFLTENCCQGLNSAACTPKRKVKCKPKAVLA
jgi:DNA-binding transcriptional ArsR family regulator